MTTITGRQASTTAGHASFGSPLVVEHATPRSAAPGSASHEKQNPPVGRYLSRRSVSMWWRSTAAW